MFFGKRTKEQARLSPGRVSSRPHTHTPPRRFILSFRILLNLTYFFSIFLPLFLSAFLRSLERCAGFCRRRSDQFLVLSVSRQPNLFSMSLQTRTLSAGDHDARAFNQVQPTHKMSADDTHITLKPNQGVSGKLMARPVSPVPQGIPNDESHLTHDLSPSAKRDSSSASASPKESGMQTPTSRSTPPPVSSRRTKPPKPPATGPQLIGHLPKAEEAARATFVEVPQNIYQYSTLGRSREALESMMCDCQYEHGTFSSPTTVQISSLVIV